MERKRFKKYICFYGSDILHGRQERRRAKRDMLRGLEPQPRYTTGKQWTD